MAREDVILNFITRGARTVSRNLGDIRTQSVRASRSVGNLDRALSALGGFLTIRALQQYADTFTLLQNRLRLVTEGTAELNTVTEELFGISQRTFTRLEDTGTLYARLARSVSELNITQRELLDITESINQATALSSPTIQAANAGLVQLAQAIGSDRLGGDELRSILENIPRVGQAVADGLGVPFQKLRELGAQGRLTAQSVLEALQSQIATVDAEFQKFIPSISFALTQLDNAFLRFIGRTDQAAGASRAISQAITFLADNFDALAKAVLAAGAVLGAGAIAGAIGQIAAAARGLTVALGALIPVLVANPIGAFVAVLGAAVAGLVAFQDKIRPFENDIITLGDTFSAVGSLIEEDFGSVFPSVGDFIDAAGDKFASLIETVTTTGRAILEFLIGWQNNIIGFWVGSFNATQLIFERGFDALIDIVKTDITELGNTLITGVEASINAVADLLDLDDLRVSVPRFEFDEDARRNARQFSAEFNGIIFEAFNTDFVGDAVNGVLTPLDDLVTRIKNRAAEIALAREALELQGQDALNRKLGVGSEDVDTDGLEKLKQSGESTADVIKDLIRENAILAQQLTLTTDEATDFARAQNIINRQLDNGREVTASQAQQIRELVTQQREFTDTLGEQQRLLAELNGAQDQYSLSVRAADNLLAQSLITLTEYNSILRDVKLNLLDASTTGVDGFERGILRLEDSLTNFAETAENFVGGTFRSLEDAFVEFTQTGKLSFSSLVDSILADLTRIAFRDSIAQLFGLGGGAVGSGGGAFEGILSGIGSLFGGLPGFARGGSFDVDSGSAIGNVGGTDNRLIAFRARDGENVTVTPPGESKSGGETVNNFNFNINTPDADSFGRSQPQLMARASAAARRASTRNN